ncbi:AraC family transcriptional regulator [Colwellia sp. E2M01]|uniref:helix-turn-helix transcriptional regulator n=1 Tax=Colwellia sp. E2M01 TaxID=2841561 RepID=UPI001C08533F|nr:AraC family transcriptional regulator [Colwellia sp. E2M01]MBU2871867.1 AraC family transcriptional regulator [Colwellia sp. E2M01]
MDKLISIIKAAITEAATSDNCSLPFAVYSSIKEQHLLNVPVVKPLLIAVLAGDKQLGKQGEISCGAGNFIFLSDNPAIDMRNIPQATEYFALLIEFEYEDFIGLRPYSVSQTGGKPYCVGEISTVLNKCLQQFVEWSVFSPQDMWSIRRKEILQLLYYLGYQNIVSMAASHKVGQKIHTMLSAQPAVDVPLAQICQQLAMSESTLRRKLLAEGSTIQEIKDQVKLGLGLHLIQTTEHSIIYIAEQCGYQSQSRFTERFKHRFGLTPSALRKTKVTG